MYVQTHAFMYMCILRCLYVWYICILVCVQAYSLMCVCVCVHVCMMCVSIFVCKCRHTMPQYHVEDNQVVFLFILFEADSVIFLCTHQASQAESFVASLVPHLHLPAGVLRLCVQLLHGFGDSNLGLSDFGRPFTQWNISPDPFITFQLVFQCSGWTETKALKFFYIMLLFVLKIDI